MDSRSFLEYWWTTCSERDILGYYERILERDSHSWETPVPWVSLGIIIKNIKVTIHPCNHSVTIKAFLDKARENGVELKPHQSLFIFLKFMQSVMPTVVYDQIVDITLGNDDWYQ